MTTVSNSVNVVTTLGQINEVLGSYRLLRSKPSFTEIRRAIALLKKYQIIEPLDVLGLLMGMEIDIYPTIQVVLFGDEIRGLLQELVREMKSLMMSNMLQFKTQEIQKNQMN